MIINNCHPWKILSQYFNFYLKVLNVEEWFKSVFINPDLNSIWQRSDYPPSPALFYHSTGKPLDDIEPYPFMDRLSPPFPLQGKKRRTQLRGKFVGAHTAIDTSLKYANKFGAGKVILSRDRHESIGKWHYFSVRSGRSLKCKSTLELDHLTTVIWNLYD